MEQKYRVTSQAEIQQAIEDFAKLVQEAVPIDGRTFDLTFWVDGSEQT